ncbi:MAG: hypothetical protein P9L99_18740 [Candidatus Lernaella stagnicola]|nr:hypothetical protein [Candidatus Lernaella stagnicola]
MPTKRGRLIPLCLLLTLLVTVGVGLAFAAGGVEPDSTAKPKPHPYRPPDPAKTLYDKGVQLMNDGQTDAAKDLFKGLIVAYPDSPYTAKARNIISKLEKQEETERTLLEIKKRQEEMEKENQRLRNEIEAQKKPPKTPEPPKPQTPDLSGTWQVEVVYKRTNRPDPESMRQLSQLGLPPGYLDQAGQLAGTFLLDANDRTVSSDSCSSNGFLEKAGSGWILDAPLRWFFDEKSGCYANVQLRLVSPNALTFSGSLNCNEQIVSEYNATSGKMVSVTKKITITSIRMTR